MNWGVSKETWGAVLPPPEESRSPFPPGEERAWICHFPTSPRDLEWRVHQAQVLLCCSGAACLGQVTQPPRDVGLLMGAPSGGGCDD